ncbi:MBL fold metallo-hydrolase [Thiolinea disciformis]|uniref:MBL fold metallo-hydrolase n=1 Tax=Thiolinea disciformis TaxID=125614 RepID=UPI00037F5049|nr:MBL fold metallo-hydrolase [Thiolinea disciformis]
MLFKQLFEKDSSTYTYLLACEHTGECVLIDPVIDTVERDLKVLQELGLKLTYTLETHIHADHLTGALKLRHLTGSKIVVPAMDGLACADLGVQEGESFQVGQIELHPLYTPGHTNTHHAYLLDNGMQQVLFSGDALLIEACGRTDFQSGDAGVLYDSIHNKFFSLPDETLVYPAHDYEGRQITTIRQEKLRNPRLGNNRSREDFVALMNGLNLPYPRKIDFAVPGNRLCGQCPDNVPEQYRGPCGIQESLSRRSQFVGDQG